MSRAAEKAEYELRESRLHALRSSSPKHQLDRLKPLEHQLELALARVAPQLAPIVISRLVESLILHPEVLIRLSGSELAELPSTPAGWNEFAKLAIKAEPLAVLNIESQDKTRREELRQAYLGKLSPADKMNQSRNGTLDAKIASFVDAELRRSAGL